MYSEANPYTNVNFVEEFGDFIGDRLDDIDILVEDFEFHVKHVNDSENVMLHNLLDSFGQIQNVDFPTHQSEHTLGLIVIKEKDNFSISDPVEKCCILNCSFGHSCISINRPHVNLKTKRSIRIENFNEVKIIRIG